MKQGWAIRKISEVGRVFNGNSINEKVKKDNYANIDKGVPFLATKDIGFDTTIDYDNGVRIPFSEKGQFKIAPKNTPLICAEGGSAGRKIGFTNQEVCFGNKLFAFVPDKGIHSKFVFYYYFTPAFQENFLTGMAGIIGGVSMNKFKDIEIPIPPLSEQVRIVSILDKAFAAIDKAKANTEKNLQNVRELFEGYMQEIFENKGDGWNEMTLEEVVEKNCTLSYGIVQPGEEVANGLPIVRPTDLTSRYVKVDGLKKINSVLADGYNRTRLFGNELLLCVRGSTGVVSVATEELAGANVTRGIVPIRFNSNIVTQDFGYFLLVSSGVQKQIKAKTYGAALMQINIGDLRKILVTFPSVSEQISIVRKLNSFFEKTNGFEILNRKKINALEELKKSILQNAFANNQNI